MGRVCQGPSLSWAEFVMGRDVPESFYPLLQIYCDSVYISWMNQVKLVFLFIINRDVNFECISIAKHIINLFNDKLKV